MPLSLTADPRLVYRWGFRLLALALPLSIAISNILWIPMAVLFGWELATRRLQWRHSSVDIPILIFCAVIVLTALLGGHSLTSLESMRDFSLLIIFWMTDQRLEHEEIPLILRLLIIASVVSGAWGVMQWVMSHSDACVQWGQSLGSRTHEYLFLKIGRAMGSRSHYLTYAESLLYAWALILPMFFREFRWSRTIAFLLITLGIVFSMTRMAWMICILFVAVELFRSRWKGRWQAASGILLLIAVFFMASPLLQHRAMTLLQAPSDAMVIGRFDIWKAGGEVIKRSPWLGVGWNNVSTAADHYYVPYVRDQTAPSVGHLHNTYLQFWAASGIVGLIAFLGMMAAFTLPLFRFAPWEIKYAALTFLLSGLTETNFNDAEILMMFLFIAAVGHIVIRSPNRLESSDSQLS